jgi:hypothetical protein
MFQVVRILSPTPGISHLMYWGKFWNQPVVVFRHFVPHQAFASNLYPSTATSSSISDSLMYSRLGCWSGLCKHSQVTHLSVIMQIGNVGELNVSE